MYTALWAGNLAIRAHETPSDADPMNKLIEDGRERYESDRKSSVDLLDSLRRQLGIAAETGDRRHFRSAQACHQGRRQFCRPAPGGTQHACAPELQI